MKNLYTVLVFILFAGLTGLSQSKVDYDSRSRFYLDLNVGGTYHSNTEVDVNKLYRGGAGFAFGYSFGMKPQNLLSVDLQVRYLLAAYRGISDSKYTLNTNTNDVLNLNEAPLEQVLDYENAYGYYVPNFHSWVNDWSLELKLNTNRLRENTGWNFFALGGIGTTRYNTRVDFYDPSSAGQVKLEDDLFEKKILLSDYETPMVNKRDWMPHFGLGIERQITPNAAFQVMGRMSWTRNNDFDGLANSFSGEPSASNDRYHYASAGVKFYLRGRTNNYVDEDDDPIVRPNPNPPVQGQKPVAKFTDPNRSPITVTASSYTVNATVQNVAGKQNIEFRQNGQIVTAFNYNANTDKLVFPANLVQGQNTFTVSAVNNFGKAEDQTIIVYTPINTMQPPVVTITNPGVASTTINNSVYNFTATVLNVDGKQNISFYVNGYSYSSFNYNSSNNQLSTTLNLVPGKNVVTVTGTNSVGSDSKSVEIIYRSTTSGPPPVVSILTPNSNPSQTSVSTANLIASVSNVSSKNDITVKVNGNSTSNFSYTSSNGKVTMSVGLVQGNNTVEVIGVNAYGQDAASTTIVYQQAQNVQPPVVSIITPANGTGYTVSAANVQGKVLYVNSKNDINVYVNGSSVSNFSYSNASNLVSFTANLVDGNNTIQIVGSNADGQDQASVNVIYTRPVTLIPPVVNIIDPATDNKVYTTPNITAKATVLNVSNKNNITVNFNGSNTNNFTYNASSNLVSIPVTLSSGSNTLIVSATNNDGSDSRQRLIMYKRAVVVNPPSVVFTNPSVSPVTVKNNKFTVTAQTTNITTKGQIILKQNGLTINSSAYSFVGSTISYPATLAVGNNIFEVTVSNTAGADSKNTTLVYEKEADPCTKPTIGYVAPSPNSTVSAASQVIEAQINNHVPGTTVTLKLNGSNKGTMTYNASTQIAKKTVTLNQGINTLEVTVTNDCGTNKSTFILNYKGTVPCNAPIVKVVSSGGTVTSNVYALSATVTNVTTSNQVTLKVNGANQVFNLINGKLTSNITLASGVNSIVVLATNSCGNDTKTVTVTYNPCQPPKLNLVKPSGTSVTTTSSNYDFILKASGDVNQSDITVTLNGSAIAFTYNAVLKTITVNATNLKNGNNKLKVFVANKCGSDVIDYTINASLCISPVVTITMKSNTRNNIVNSLNLNFTALVQNMTSKTGITLNVNGKPVNFNYSAVSGSVSASLLLKEGQNSIVLSATNGCGSDSKTYTVTAKTCDVPKLTAVSPRLTSVTDQNTATFIVNTIGVANANEITVKLNGTTISKKYSNGKVTVSTNNLKMGVNTLIVSAKNNCGTDKVTYTITRKACDKPVVKISSKASNVTSLSFPFTATVSNVVVKQDIVLKVNNKAVSFNFNSKTGLVSSNVALVEGNNTIVLSANNKCGNGSASHIVTATTCKQPEIKVGYPTNTNITTANSTFSIIAIGINVTQSEIKVTNNGKSIPFTFASATGKITVAVSNMTAGANNIKIKGTNPCGTSEVNYVLTYTGSSSNSPGGRAGKTSNSESETPQKRN